MQAIGLIETRGLVTAIEAADAMTKSADVKIIEKTYVGGGLVTIVITGDVGAVKAAIEAGSASVKQINEEFLISEHVIPRPHEELECIVGNTTKNEVEENEVTIEEENEDNNTSILEDEKESEEELDNEEILEENEENFNDDLNKLPKNNSQGMHKQDVDNLVNMEGLEKAISTLSKLKVVKLRNLAREYEDFVIKGRTVSKADKKLLIAKFKAYYEKN
ncbi:BMC domain-containing protein [Clostridium ihumii]|uniref:BMC domain-containing protein n=1 Tax=Clostridium ihumii TaxID=1470356 RepID=UPI00058C602D|nr:BMC domain-containing protein [Clostridium ihumii]